MAQFKIGSLTTPTSIGPQYINVGFQPKAIIFWTTVYAAGTANSWDAHVAPTIGFSDGASSYCVTGFSQDALATSNSSRAVTAHAIALLAGAGTLRARAGIDYTDATGFGLNWDLASSQATTVMYLAIGGEEVEAKVIDWTSPTSPGHKSVTGVGFTPEVVFHAASSWPTMGGTAVHQSVGFGVMNSQGEQWTNSLYAENGNSTSNTTRYQRSDRAISTSYVSGILEEAEFVSMDADGFTLNFMTAYGDTYHYPSLCLSGVRTKLGDLKTPSLAEPQSIVGAGFTPELVMLSSITSISTLSSPEDHSLWSLGASDGVSERAAGMADEDALGTTEAKAIWFDDSTAIGAWHGGAFGPPNINDRASLSSFDSDGFTLDWSVSGGGIDFVYVALASAPVAPDAPAVTSPVDSIHHEDLSDGVDFSWTHSHQSGDSQTGWAIKRQAMQWNDGPGLQSEQWWEAKPLPASGVPTVVDSDTTTSNLATGYGNQRHIDRCQNGVLWSFFHNGSGVVEAWCSTDEGATWANGGANFSTNNASYVPSLSLFIDIDDYCHVAYRNGNTGYIEYRRGTPNAARTNWTWSSAYQLYTASTDLPDIIAHKEGSGWVAHVVYSRSQSGADFVIYNQINISSGGSITVDSPFVCGRGDAGTNYGNTNHKYPSIDFDHIGDGKTASATPHLYIGWSSGATGTGQGIRFRKAVYSGGTWSWNSERGIDSDFYVINAARTLSCIYDGTAVMIGGAYLRKSNGADFPALYERDAGDTQTIERDMSGVSSIGHGSMTYDDERNIYMIGSTSSAIGGRVWNRAANKADVLGNLTPHTFGAGAKVTVKRGYSESKIELCYIDGGTSPYSVKYLALEKPAPRWATSEKINHGIASSVSFTDDWNNDVGWRYALATESEGGLSPYTDWRYINPYEWWDGSQWLPLDETDVTSSSTEVSTLPSEFSNGPYQWTAATADGDGNWSSYAPFATFTFTTNTPPDAPVIQVPADNYRTQRTLIAFSWTFNDSDSGDVQTAYALKRQREGGSEEWWNGSTWVESETFIATSETSVSIHSDTFDTGIYTWSVATKDQSDSASAYSAPQTLEIIRFERWGIVQI